MIFVIALDGRERIEKQKWAYPKILLRFFMKLFNFISDIAFLRYIAIFSANFEKK